MPIPRPVSSISFNDKNQARYDPTSAEEEPELPWATAVAVASDASPPNKGGKVAGKKNRKKYAPAPPPDLSDEEGPAKEGARGVVEEVEVPASEVQTAFEVPETFSFAAKPDWRAESAFGEEVTDWSKQDVPVDRQLDHGDEQEVVAFLPPSAALPPPAPSPPALAPPPQSPRPALSKPLSIPSSPPQRSAKLARPAQGSYRGMPFSTQPSTARRLSSIRTSPRPHFVEPVAPPHKPQPHFYGLPDLGLNFGQKKEKAGGKPAGSDGYCCCFDTFADSGDVVSGKKAKDALLVGSEGGLEVFRVLPNKFEVVGRLEGLRGSVIGAKVLPHTGREDALQSLRPLVAVIVHGKITEEQIPAKEVESDEEDELKQAPSYYQTTVEIYSLQTQLHVATLYKSTLAVLEPPTVGHLSTLPGPIGELRVCAAGRFVLVVSGKSGEVFIFSHANLKWDEDPHFRCIGKYWTSLQLPLESAARSSDGPQAIDDGETKHNIPLFGFSQRWLAIVPPTVTSHVSIGGSPLLAEDFSNPPGLATHVAPPQPAVTCDIAGVDAEGTWSRLTRQAAQSLVKYGQKSIEIGWQGWKELTNPTPPSAQQHSRSGSREAAAFPPTNAPAEDPRRTLNEPAVVSLIDMVGLLEAEELRPKYPPAPLSTFALPEGCNHLSVSSNGLRLLTVSRKGDSAVVWDLMQACHGSSRQALDSADDSASGPCVKQLHRIGRSSQSIVVDSAWSRDDDMLAMLTAHGTIHLHEVPATMSPRKRKRTGTNTVSPAGKARPTVSVSQGLSPPSTNGFLGSIRTGWQQMSTQVSTIRTQNPVSGFGIPTTFAGFKEATASAGHAGGRVLAKGLSSGYTAAKGGASDYWHADDNKIRHRALQERVHAGALRWVRRPSSTFLGIVCGGTVHLHPVQHVSRRKGDIIVTGLKHDRHGKKTFGLPPIRTVGDVDGAGGKKSDDCAAEGPHGFWSLRITPAADETRSGGKDLNILPSCAHEVETNPPYCPFHIDARVSIYSFDVLTRGSLLNLCDEKQTSSFHLSGHGVVDEQPWMFGEPLPPSTKMNIHEEIDDVPSAGGQDNSTGSEREEDVADQMESKLTIHTADDASGGEQIRIHTRRARTRLAEDGRGDREVLRVDEDLT